MCIAFRQDLVSNEDIYVGHEYCMGAGNTPVPHHFSGNGDVIPGQGQWIWGQRETPCPESTALTF